jgi:hypothetical protein
MHGATIKIIKKTINGGIIRATVHWREAFSNDKHDIIIV